MTFEKRVQKSYTSEHHNPDLGSASDWLKICFDQPKSLPRSSVWNSFEKKLFIYFNNNKQQIIYKKKSDKSKGKKTHPHPETKKASTERRAAG